MMRNPHLPPPKSSINLGGGRKGFLIFLTFLSIDWAWIPNLPRLGISFGPPHLPLLFFSAVRLALFLAWLLLIGLHSPDPAGGKTPRRANQLSNHNRTSTAPLLAFNLGLLAVALYGFLIEPFWIRTTRLELTAKGAGLIEPLRIIQLSDLHIERTTRRERELIDKVNALQPDLIVLTGDYLNLSYLYDEQAVASLRSFTAGLRAPLGIYAVDGTVEDPPRTRELFAGLGVRILDQEVLRIDAGGGQLTLVGVSNTGYAFDQESLRNLMGTVQQEEYSLLIYHTPDLAYDAQAAAVDLYLCGHTHGGQIRLPLYGALITFSRFGKTFEAGRYDLGDTILYVSRGIGLEGKYAPRVRLFTPPELVMIDLMP